MPKILVFDSGSGSIPIARAIRKYVPNSEISLLADSEFFPYGERSDDELIARMQMILGKAYELLNPDIIVLACNTASTIALDELRAQLACPIIGVVPAIKPAAQATKSNIIGLIATPATIQRTYTDNLINEFAPDCQVIRHGSTDLVLMSEDYAKTGKYDEVKLRTILQPFILAKERGLDQVVLGCTHFVLLLDPISEILSEVAIIDSSDAIGRQVQRVAEQVTFSSDCNNSADTFMYKTKDNQVIKSDRLRL